MKITDGPTLALAERTERGNIHQYLGQIADWWYEYVNGTFTRMKARYENGKWSIERKALTPEEVGIVALAGRYFKPNFPENDIKAQKEFAEYQFQLQQYLWITDPQSVIDFYDGLISSVRSEHNKLIPVLHTYHAQIHALKIAYEALKWEMNQASPATRAIFWLVCIEFMKLQVRLYLIESQANTEEWKHLDWIFMLDKVFDDFSFRSSRNRSSLRRENVVEINPYHDLGLEKILLHIKEIRDMVDAMKRGKAWARSERHDDTWNRRVKPDYTGKLLVDVRRRVWDTGV